MKAKKCKTPGVYNPFCDCSYCARKKRGIQASWKIANMRRKVSRARNFPWNTCPSSRHLVLVADQLSAKGKRHNVEECWDREHIAQSIYATVAALWRIRSQGKDTKGQREKV